MRFSVDIFLKGTNEFYIPTTYRRNITSLIKEAIKGGDEKSELYEKYYGDKSKNITKPFTFSLFIPEHRVEKKDGNKYLIVESNIMKFFFSSYDYRFLLELYNGIVNINPDFTPFNYPVEFKYFHLKKETQINTNKIKFETLSPVVVRNIEDKKGTGYVTFEDEKFKEMLFFSIRNLCQNFISKDFDLRLKDFDVNFLNCKKVKIYHYESLIPCTKGIFEINAPKEVLTLIYDVGLGAKRGQGFGMVELMS